MKIHRKILLMGVLFALTYLTTVAHACWGYSTVDVNLYEQILTADISQVDKYLNEFDPAPYKLIEGWQFGIIEKKWVTTSPDDSAFRAAEITIRVTGKESETILLASGYSVAQIDINSRSWKTDFKKLQPGDLVAFGKAKIDRSGKVHALRIIKKNTETRFYQVLERHDHLYN